MVNDPLSDLLTQIKNGYMAGRAEVVLPWSKLKETVVGVLVKEGYITEKKVDGNTMTLKLKYDNKTPAVTDIKRISKPSLRIYVKKNELPRVLGGLGTAVVSTPAGIMTAKEARKKGFGGEVICEIW